MKKKRSGVAGKVSFYLYVKPEIKKWVQAQAKKDERSASIYVERLIEQERRLQRSPRHG